MKLIILLILLTLSPVFGGELPYNVREQITKRDRAHAKADKAYIDALKKLKIYYTKQGNLDIALAIRDLIREVPGEDDSMFKAVLGVWNFSYKGMQRKFSFTEDNKFIGHFPASGNQVQGTWELEDNTIALTVMHDGKSVAVGTVILDSASTATYSKDTHKMSGSKVLPK